MLHEETLGVSLPVESKPDQKLVVDFGERIHQLAEATCIDGRGTVLEPMSMGDVAAHRKNELSVLPLDLDRYVLPREAIF